jgi:hypothetical protein
LRAVSATTFRKCPAGFGGTIGGFCGKQGLFQATTRCTDGKAALGFAVRLRNEFRWNRSALLMVFMEALA